MGGRQSMLATGGSVEETDIDGVTYRVHTFTSSGTLDVTWAGLAEWLVVAGGGGGRGQDGGPVTNRPAGGAGGLLQGEGLLDAGEHSVTVGAGGLGGVGNNVGENGQNSVFQDTEAVGGGTSHTDGGSGGGGLSDFLPPGKGVDGQGHDGGPHWTSGGTDKGGGGGGAGGTPTSNSAPGPGLVLSFDGTSREYARGGEGGGGHDGQPRGWGGDGATSCSICGPRNGGDGGNGIVIVRYPV